MYGALDVGNGGDPSAFCIVKGSVCIHMEVWPSSSNLVRELRRAFTIADRFGLTEFCADTVGVGAGIEGIAATLNTERTARDRRGTRVTVHSFKGSEGPIRPEKPSTPGSKVKAKDWYPNKKSQSYDNLRYRFALTYQILQGDRARNDKDAHHYISISSEIPAEARNQLMLELAQITCEESPGGKLQVDKYGEGASPNASDALAMATAPRKMQFNISDATIEALSEH